MLMWSVEEWDHPRLGVQWCPPPLWRVPQLVCLSRCCKCTPQQMSQCWCLPPPSCHRPADIDDNDSPPSIQDREMSLGHREPVNMHCIVMENRRLKCCLTSADGLNRFEMPTFAPTLTEPRHCFVKRNCKNILHTVMLASKYWLSDVREDTEDSFNKLYPWVKRC